MSFTPTTSATIRRRARAARRGSAVFAVAAIGIAGTAGAAYGAFSRTRTSATSSVVAAFIGKGATPTAAVSGTSVSISWATAKYNDNITNVDQYKVQRYPEGGTTATVVCANPITALSCTDSPGNGRWQYTITPVRGPWSGPGSDRSTSVAVSADTIRPNGEIIDSVPNNGASSDGRPSNGDKILYTFSERMSASSIKTGWDGSEVGVTVWFADANGRDELTVDSVNLGMVDLGTSAYVTTNKASYPVSAVMAMTTTPEGKSVVTVTLTVTNTSLVAVAATTTMKWTPSAAATDLAGNTAQATQVTQQVARRNF